VDEGLNYVVVDALSQWMRV